MLAIKGFTAFDPFLGAGHAVRFSKIIKAPAPVAPQAKSCKMEHKILARFAELVKSFIYETQRT